MSSSIQRFWQSSLFSALAALATACGTDEKTQHAGAGGSPYAGQVNSSIRGLSFQEIDDLENGRGMGLARAAELNGYPGPRHVIDLREPLEVTPDQRAALDGIFRRMDAAARELGARILEEEKALNHAFAMRAVGDADLEARMQTLADLYGRLRGTHLAAHLATQALLSPAQISEYAALRGYVTGHQHHR